MVTMTVLSTALAIALELNCQMLGVTWGDSLCMFFNVTPLLPSSFTLMDSVRQPIGHHSWSHKASVKEEVVVAITVVSGTCGMSASVVMVISICACTCPLIHQWFTWACAYLQLPVAVCLFALTHVLVCGCTCPCLPLFVSSHCHLCLYMPTPALVHAHTCQLSFACGSLICDHLQLCVCWLGFRTGMGKPAVLPKWVLQVQVQ
jgi:hypothetical protein